MQLFQLLKASEKLCLGVLPVHWNDLTGGFSFGVCEQPDPNGKRR